MGLSQSQVKENAELREQLEGALKSLEEQHAQLKSLEEQHAQLMAQLQTQREVVLKLSERIDELNNTIVSKEIEIRQLQMVRRNKLILLNEFKHLYAKFNQQMSINVPPPRTCIPKCENPSDVKGNAIDWIKQVDQRRVQNCDINARVCFAMLVGGYDSLWVEKGTHLDESAATSIENAIKVKALLFSSDNAILLIRFVDKNETDGHSLVVYKLGTTYTTFQAYYGVSDLLVFDCDVTTSIFGKINSGNISMNSTSFGFTKSSNPWDIHSKCFIDYKLL